MNEDVLNYLFEWAQSDGYKKTKEDFAKLLQSNDEVFKYAFEFAKHDGYKKDENAFSGLLGRSATSKTTETSTTESASAEPVKTEIINAEPLKATESTKSEPVAEETATDYSSVDTTPMERKGERSTPIKGIDQFTVEKVDLSDKEKADRLKDVTEAKKNAMAEDISSKLMPVTEKTQVKEVTKVEPMKNEIKSDIPSYDDLGINPEKDPGSFLGANFDKNTKFEKMSPSELIEKDIFFGRGRNVKLERNVSLRYPDPPGVVLKKENVGGKEVYSSYDKTNDKWYIYDEKSNKGNWTEVTSGPIKSMLNAKFTNSREVGGKWTKGDVIQSKIDYNSDEEDEKIRRTKEGILLNKYLPYVIKNYDNLSNEQQAKLKKDLNEGQYNMLLRKYLEKNDPNLDFWLDINDKFFQNQSTYSNAIDVYGEENREIYKNKVIEVPKLNKDIEEGKLKLLKSVAGDILYDEKNDVFYYGPSKRDLKQTTTSVSEGDGIYKEVVRQEYLKTIPKGTPAYDKIKNSLSKYNK